MSRAIPIADGTADEAAARGTLVGYSIRESAVSPAVATVVLRNGDGASDPMVAVIELAASGSETTVLPAVECPDGIYVDRVAGSTEVILYVA